jgi:hypothetical protein
VKSGRGEPRRPVLAGLLLASVEDELSARVSGDSAIGHDLAGRLLDHALEAFEAVRDRFGIEDGMKLLLDAPDHPRRRRQKGQKTFWG